MRILHVTRETTADRRYGIGRSLEPVLVALRQRGHEVELLTRADLSPGREQALQRWTLRAQALLRRLLGGSADAVSAVGVERLQVSLQAARLAAEWRAHVVHLHDPWLAAGFRCGRRWAGAARARWGFTAHGFGVYAQAVAEEGFPVSPHSSPRLWRALLRLERSTADAAAFVTCPTELGRQAMATGLGHATAPDHWHAVPHALRELALPARESARHVLGIGADEWLVLAVGRLAPVKRMDAVVRACLHSGLATRLVVLGAGDAAPLQAMVDAEGGQRVRLRVQSVDDVAPWLAAADVYVSASLNESFGLATLEAQAAGLPVVCTAVGGVPEVTGGAARLVPGSGDNLVPALARALVELHAQPELRRQLGLAGLDHAQAWPRAGQVAQAYETAYLDAGRLA